MSANNLAAAIQGELKKQASGFNGAVDLVWKQTGPRMTGGTYKNKALFKSLCDKTLADAKKLSSADRKKKVDSSVAADKPAKPIDTTASDACARHMAWAIADAYFICGGK